MKNKNKNKNKNISKVIASLIIITALILSVCIGVMLSKTQLLPNANDSTASTSESTSAKEASSSAPVTSQTEASSETTQRNTENTETSVSETETKTEAKTEKETESEPQTNPPFSSVTSKGYKIETIDGVTYVDGVLVANKTYSLPKNYGSGLTKECSSAFNSMKEAAQKDGVKIEIISGYRSYDTQNRIYNNYVAKDGKKNADTYSARPGTSEHQTGLAMDLNSLSSSFGKTKEGKWLAENCFKYGFIIRYPEGKQNITGYVYEPWHVRYIGKEKATAIYESGLCFEEYYGITSKYG